MKTPKIYNERLLKFADYLTSQADIPDKKLTPFIISDVLPNGDRTQAGILEASWILDYLPFCFDEEWWFDSQSNEPTMNENDGSKIISVFEFFGLERADEYRHLFGIRGQHLNYGNQTIDEESSLVDYAQNIVEFVRRRNG